jgi:hypothetical protein
MSRDLGARPVRRIRVATGLLATGVFAFAAQRTPPELELWFTSPPHHLD